MVSGMKDGIQRWSAINAGTLTAETLTSAGYTEAQAQAYLNGALAPWSIALLVIGMLALIAFIVFINDAERRIPVQYAKRQVGRKMYGGQSSRKIFATKPTKDFALWYILRAEFRRFSRA